MALRVFRTLKRTALEFREDNLADWAAALTYYGLLSLFPALIALVSIIGLVADPQATTDKVTEIVTAIGPDSAADTYAGPIESITSNRSAAGILLVAGLALALWSASGYVGAFMRASNVVYEVPEGRPFWKLRPLQILITLVMVFLLALLALALVLTGPVAESIAGPLGFGDAALTAWDIAKWPVMLLVAMGMIAVLYYASPNARLRGFRWITPGSAFAVTAWLVASVAFAVYVASFGAYDKTYGSLGGVVVLLVWMWISNLALLFGHQLNAELERERQMAEGDNRASEEIQLEPRTTPQGHRSKRRVEAPQQ
jgi:membrane protein